MYLQIIVCIFYSFAYFGSSSKLHTVYKVENIRQEEDPLPSIDSGVKEINKKLDSVLDIFTRNSTKIGICTKDYHGESKPKSCADLRLGGATCDGVYEIYLDELQGKPVKVVCDMTTNGGGWTVFMRRGNYNDRMTSFQKSWGNYKNGFGDADGEFWLGNEVLYLMTKKDLGTTLRVHLTAYDLDEIYLDYTGVQLDNESTRYSLHIDAPYKVPPPLKAIVQSLLDSDESGFVTYDHSDESSFVTYDHCFSIFGNACEAECRCGWWWSPAGERAVQLTGQYFFEGCHKNQSRGILWQSWKGNDSLKAAELMLRPTAFNLVD